jgi:hypothetical protein
LNGNGPDYDIVETILIESSDSQPQHSTDTTDGSAAAGTSNATTEQNDCYFNNKLKKLYKDLDTTLRMSYKMLNRNSLDARMSGQAGSEEGARIVSNRIYLAGQNDVSVSSADDSKCEEVPSSSSNGVTDQATPSSVTVEIKEASGHVEEAESSSVVR